MRSLKTLIILGLLGITFTGVSFGYLEDGLYCNIQSKNTQGNEVQPSRIKISLNKNDGGKCNEYVKYLEQKMKDVYKDILVIQGYIKKKQDAGYRKPIKEEKTKLLNELQKRRLSILINMRTFEKNLLTKFRELFLAKIVGHKQKLESALVTMQALSGSASNQSGIERYIELTTSTLNAIKGIENAKTLTRFNERVKEYLYLTKQLEGK